MIRKPSFLRRALSMSALGLTLTLAAAPQAQTLTGVMHAGLRSLDPIITSGYIVRNFGYMVYDTLLALDVDGNIQPQMLDSWVVSDDGKTYTFTLRDGLQWHDGTPVTAEDCLASLDRWSKLDKTGQVMASLLTETAVVDDTTFTMQFSEPTDIILRSMARPSSVPAFMMPKALAETPIHETLREVNGSGPFRFVDTEYRPGVQAVFDKNTDYVPRAEPANGLAGGKVVNVDRVKWVTMPDAMTATNALLNQEIDYIEQVPHDLLPLIESRSDLNLVVDPLQNNQTAMRLNFLHPPFNNKLLRQAALLAIDQTAALQAQIGNPQYFQTCPAVFGCSSPYASDHGSDDVVKSNVEAAKALLKEANYDGTPVVILHPTDVPVVTPVPPVLAQALRNAGFNVDLQAMDWQTLLTRRASLEAPDKGGWNAFVTFTVMSDARDPLGFQWMSANGKEAWFGWPDIPAAEDLRAQFARSDDPDALSQIAEDVHQLALDEVLIVPLGEFSVVTATSDKVSDILPSPVPVFWNLKKN